MILLYPPGAERLRRAQRNMEEGRYAGPIRRLVRGYLDRQQLDDTVLKGVLHLNARNPLLRRVRDLGPEHPSFAPLVSILAANARMFAGQGLSAQDAIACFEQINRSLSRLADMDAAPADGRHPLTPLRLGDLGLHPEAAARLCAACETVEDLLVADVQTLAERARISPLLLATLREELRAETGGQSAGAAPAGEAADPGPSPVRERGAVVSLAEVKAARGREGSAASAASEGNDPADGPERE